MLISSTLSLSRLDRGRPVSRQIQTEFHLTAESRKRYRIDHPLFASAGSRVMADMAVLRRAATAINETRTSEDRPPILIGDLYVAGLIDEIFHYVITLYVEENGDSVFHDLDAELTEALGPDALNDLLASFVEKYPPKAVYAEGMSVEEYLSHTEEGVPVRHVIWEELLMTWITNKNPAYTFCEELFDDEPLVHGGVYRKVIAAFHRFFDAAKPFGPEDQQLIDFLRSPSLAYPESLYDQLEYIRERWGLILGDYLLRVLKGLGMLQEGWMAKGGGPGEMLPYSYESHDIERFSPDSGWMPNVVLLAKSTLVWLHQLSTQYGREIRRLDEIPEEELDLIASRGFNALWLIGIWQRSDASRTIKRSCGNAEAESSAYSLFDYDIAWQLGGWEALERLVDQCYRRGIRLASDMVPNHTGIDSLWVHEHPEYFLQLDHPPYPSYTYGSQNLSSHPDIDIRLEDHYYDKSDAAVTFLRIDHRTGEHRYIYHGNDGTHMPWNDTAQLDYLNPDVREAVIEKIKHVARNFPIIRFDAAMTLAKKHIQRLWYPLPGSPGDIPSRGALALPQEEFDKAIPEEFWREVVDRIGEEVSDTLLLAEAFWMMEGYFVRTLGMHRVYNSAFMHMMKNEDNAKYRQTMKNTLEYDPEILKRWVNFMNNPDEETAAEQFGKGDKYLGVCTILLTMPGLPMIGHGQVEGFYEKYGMEYTRAYQDEKVDGDLLYRHEQFIFPLMRRRHLFSSVENFWLFDLVGDDGGVNENVFAFANRHGSESTLVLYNNGYHGASGRIHWSTQVNRRKPDGSRVLENTSLASALGLRAEAGDYCVLRDNRARLSYVRRSGELADGGLSVQLEGYQAQVFFEIYEVADGHEGLYGKLCGRLAGAGSPDLDRDLRRIALDPLHHEILHALNALADGEAVPKDVAASLVKQLGDLGWAQAKGVKPFEPGHELRFLASAVPALFPDPDSMTEVMALEPIAWFLDGRETTESEKLRVVSDLPVVLRATFVGSPTKESEQTFLTSSESERMLGVHEYAGVRYFRKEGLEELQRAIEAAGMKAWSQVLEKRAPLAEKVGWKWDEFLTSSPKTGSRGTKRRPRSKAAPPPEE